MYKFVISSDKVTGRNLSLLCVGSGPCVMLKILPLILGILALRCQNYSHSDYYVVLLGCFPGAPLWNMYSFIDKSHYFYKKKKKRSCGTAADTCM